MGCPGTSVYVVSALNAAFLPNPGIFVGISLDLCPINVSVIQIYTQLTEYIAFE